jgi:hypothetical protein
MRKTVCVDLDGVLARYDGWKGEDHIGEPVPGAAEFTHFLSRFARVVVFTTRVKADLADRLPGTTPEQLAERVKAWLDEHGFDYDEVYQGQGKPIAAAYIDDRAVRLPTNPGLADFAEALDETKVLCGVQVSGE